MMFIPERKVSYSRETQANLVGLDFSVDDGPDAISREWVYSRWAKISARLAALISLTSVSMNTPVTFKEVPSLVYVTLILDIVVAVILTIEMIGKMHIEGVFRPASSQSSRAGHDSKIKQAYFQRFWNCFDACMLFFVYASLVLQAFELRALLTSSSSSSTKSLLAGNPYETGFWHDYGYLSFIRCPRPLILLRVFRAVLRLQLPEARVKAIFQRSAHQVYNVALFLLFFMTFYGLLGVQFFGDELNFHCVSKYATESNVTKSDLAVPDTYCNKDRHVKDQCPPEMKCMRITSSIEDEGGYAGFKHAILSIFTVYQAASQEGWVFIMYRAMDCLESWKGVVYFMTMIFLVAWLVKVFQSDGITWKLVPIRENKPKGLAPNIFQQTILKSTGFNIAVMILVVASQVTAAAQQPTLQKQQSNSLDAFFYAEVLFTIVFDLEALFKIWCLGWTDYWRRSLFKFELFLCIGTSLHCIPYFYRTELTYIQVLRTVRLIKASPMLEDFCFKIFGPAKKLGSLILFTNCFLVITSSISLQLFCFVQAGDPKFVRFSTFPKALMSLFQILTQKGWVAVMHDTMDAVKKATLKAFVAIFFVFYHFVVTLIVLSLFVAVILDNLELDEDIKKLKQLKLREMSAETQQKLPMRLRVFEKFPNRPQMIQLTRLVSDFLMPKIRDSFMRQFAAVSALEEVEDETIEEMLASFATNQQAVSSTANKPADKQRGDDVKGGKQVIAINGADWLLSGTSVQRETIRAIKRKVKGLHGQEKVRAIIYLLNESNKTRLLTSEQTIIPTPRSLLSTQHQIRQERRSMRQRAANTIGSPFGTSQIVPGLVKSRRPPNGDLTSPGRLDGGSSSSDAPRSGRVDIKLLQQKAQMAEAKRTQQEVELRENHPFFDRPLFALARENRFRQLCLLIVEARLKVSNSIESIDGIGLVYKLLGHVTYLDGVAILVTMVSCASMLVETPHQRLMNTPLVQIFEYLFFVEMTFEVLLKILANGLIFTPNALLKDFGGFLDLFNYIISLTFVSYLIRVDEIAPNSGQHILMILRCLRPLRIFILVPQMRRVVYELVRGFREILMVSVLLVVFMFMFAVYGTHMFGGHLAICNDREILNRTACTGPFRRELAVTKLNNLRGDHPKILVPRVWANPRNFDFDNIWHALLALFEVLSLEGWVEIRDVIGSRIGMRQTIYIHLFVFIGCLIGLTLFVGVVIANYSENKGTALLTVDQRRWLDLKGRIKLTHPLQLPPRPKFRTEEITSSKLEKKGVKFRCFIYDITQHAMFERITTVLVMANSMLLFFPLNVKPEDELTLSYLIQVNLGITFTILFSFECVIKAIALNLNGYWQSKRNRIDLAVVVLGLLWIILHFALRGSVHGRKISNNFGWIMLMLRFVTLAGRVDTLKMLMLTVVMSIYKSLFIILSMFLLMIVYALAGVVLFGSVKHGDNLGRHANFNNAFRATTLLTRIVTGEDWNKIMHDCMVQPPFCINRPTFWETNCGNYIASLVYFCSFYVIITYVMLNVLVAIIMENFSLFYSNDEDAIMNNNDIRNFQLAWNVIDVNRKGVIKASYVRFLLRLIPRDRVGFDLTRKKDQQLFKEMCYEVETLRGGRDREVSFHDVLMVLAYRTVDITKTLQLEELIAREELEYAIEEEVARQTIAAWIERCIFRNRQKHGQLKFTMHPAVDRQLSITIDEHDQAPPPPPLVSSLKKRGKPLVGVSLTDPKAVLSQGAGTSSTSSSSSSSGLLSRGESLRRLEQPFGASNERASQISAPLLLVPSNQPAQLDLSDDSNGSIKLIDISDTEEASSGQTDRSCLTYRHGSDHKFRPSDDSFDKEIHSNNDICQRSAPTTDEQVGQDQMRKSSLKRVRSENKSSGIGASLAKLTTSTKPRRSVKYFSKTGRLLPDVAEESIELLPTSNKTTTRSSKPSSIDQDTEHADPVLYQVTLRRGNRRRSDAVPLIDPSESPSVEQEQVEIHQQPTLQDQVDDQESCSDVKNWWREQLIGSPSASGEPSKTNSPTNRPIGSTSDGEKSANPRPAPSPSRSEIAARRNRVVGAAAAIERRALHKLPPSI